MPPDSGQDDDGKESAARSRLPSAQRQGALSRSDGFARVIRSGSASAANLWHTREARQSEATADYVGLIDPGGEARAEDPALIAEAGGQKQQRTPVCGKAVQDLVEEAAQDAEKDPRHRRSGDRTEEVTGAAADAKKAPEQTHCCPV